MKKLVLERIAVLFSLGLLLAAWYTGGLRSNVDTIGRISSISNFIEGVKEVSPGVYEGNRKGHPNEKLVIATADYPSYGGPMQMAVVVNGEDRVEHVAIVESYDTSTYISRVLEKGTVDAFLGIDVSQHPAVDGVTGATLSSLAMVNGIEKALASVRGEEPPTTIANVLSFEEMLKSLLTVLFFVCAYFVSSRFFRWNRKRIRLMLLALSTVTLGFLYGSQFSLSSLVMLLAGFWTNGVSSFAPLICLVLAVVTFFASKKNLFCSMVCPFGGVQEGLARITTCSPPVRSSWMKWFARLFALVAIAAALYFRNPSVALYEPFGMAFSFIGSTAIFALTILIVVASLFMKRPWCILFCPITCLFDYLTFIRSWIKRSSTRNRRESL